MGILTQPKVIFIVDAVHLPLILVVAVVIYRRRDASRDARSRSHRQTRHSCRLVDYPQVESCHLSFRLSRATRMEHSDGSAIRDNRAPSAIRFVRMCESRVNRRARYQSYLSLNKTPRRALNLVDASRAENNLSYIRPSYLIIVVRVDK